MQQQPVLALRPAEAPAAAPELAAVRAARAAVAGRISIAAAARAARAEDPAVLLAQEKVALAREKLEADIAEHELEADRVFLDACLTMGEDRVGRIPTRYGSIVIRTQGAQEIDAHEDRALAHKRAGKAAKTPAEAAVCEKNYNTVLELGFAETVLTPKAHFERVAPTGSPIWATLWRARNTLIDASVLTEGKAGAH